jgi:hypothetical protein
MPGNIVVKGTNPNGVQMGGYDVNRNGWARVSSHMKKLHAVLVGLVVLGVGSTALADVCKTPKVKVVNDKTQTIKVTKIQYFDGCDNKWRTEDVTAREIAAGGNYTFTDNLEYVGNCKVTKFKLYRAVRQSTGSAYGSFDWGGELVPDQGSSQVCNTNVTYTIHAHD